MACQNIMHHWVASKFFLSHLNLSDYLCVCFFISFRLGKRIQKYSVMSYVFNQEWLDETNPQFSTWVKLLKDPIRVLCCLCQQSFALRNMGKRALESHINSDKHKRNVSAKVPSRSSYLKKLTGLSKTSFPNSADTGTNTQASCTTATETNRILVASQMLTHYVHKDDVLKAEIIWALKVIESHFSYSSFQNIVDLLKMMLPDRKIVEKLCLGSTKLAYLITHGLAPLFS